MTPTMSTTRRAALALAFTGGLTAAATTAEADGTFFQLDLASETSDVVFAGTRGKFSYGANYSSYDSGWNAGLQVTRDFVFPDVATVKVGPSLGITDDDDVDLGLKIIVERYAPTEFGFVFLSGQYNTIQNDWFALAQFGNGKGVSIDLTAGGSDTYSEQSAALNYRLGTGPTSLRAGYRFDAQEVFVGFSVNTY